MKKTKWQDILRSAQVQEVKRINGPKGAIFIGDGASAKGDPYAYRTVWAFGRDEDSIELGRPLSFNKFYEDGGLWRGVTRDIRIQAAEQDAMEYVNAR